MGCDDVELISDVITSLFQSTHPRGVRQHFGNKIIPIVTFQSTHPRGVRRYGIIRQKSIHEFQSTHPRGVRLLALTALATRYLFQSTHPRGVRLIASLISLFMAYFNPRTHVGCDSRPFHRFGRRCDFNPRTHVGCDKPCTSSSIYLYSFQSTHPRGVRLLSHQMVGF